MKLLAVKDDSIYPWSLRIVVAMANVAHQFYVEGMAAAVSLPFEITSGMDGKHSRESRHYMLAAIDQRSNDMTDEWADRVAERLRTELGPEYQVLLEHRGKPNEHFHIQWRPR